MQQKSSESKHYWVAYTSKKGQWVVVFEGGNKRFWEGFVV